MAAPWKTSRDPDCTAKKARVEHLYAIADGEVIPEDGKPNAVFCMDEFGPLNLMPHPPTNRVDAGAPAPGWGSAPHDKIM
ncbi:hypothetical protein [Actinomadura xylanilytica]|uniref:hypothetical protein n=1 Tax=Actinomadura xylanilytica TaxID=887459 RepID=UPI00255A70D9|nr:hypothetical protein [Actinomadura xylanilytica]MDL4770806.1 hypothetical protein [Actinomadura xylanilytica]